MANITVDKVIGTYIELRNKKESIEATAKEKVAKIKVNESLKQLNKLVLGNKLSTEDKVVSLMRYYELNQELFKVNSEK